MDDDDGSEKDDHTEVPMTSAPTLPTCNPTMRNYNDVKRVAERFVRPFSLTSFPFSLHRLLETADMDEALGAIISWVPSGKGFKVHNRQHFEQEIIPHFFNQTKFKSFQRQLNLYKFSRVSFGQDKGT